MAFASTLGAASCSPAALRRPPAGLSLSILLVFCVCLQADGTAADLKKDIEALEWICTSMKEAYITKRDELVGKFAENSRALDMLQKQMLETKKFFEAVRQQHSEYKEDALKSFEDFDRQWEDTEDRIHRAKDMARLVEELKREL